MAYEITTDRREQYDARLINHIVADDKPYGVTTERCKHLNRRAPHKRFTDILNRANEKLREWLDANA